MSAQGQRRTYVPSFVLAPGEFSCKVKLSQLARRRDETGRFYVVAIAIDFRHGTKQLSILE